MIVIAIDALEFDLVEEFNCVNLKQISYGKTDISEFSQPRTMVLWSSFITGENKEKEVLKNGNKAMWEKEWDVKQTFFHSFKNPKVLDLPGFSYDKDVHDKSRALLKQFFNVEGEEKIEVRNQYNADAFKHHRKIKNDFLNALNEDHDLLLGYFSIADVIGHLSFGNKTLMRMIYKDFDDLVKTAKEKSKNVIVIADHGMEAVGAFGDHSNYGFWSTSFKSSLQNPKITDFFKFIKMRADNEKNI